MPGNRNLLGNLVALILLAFYASRASAMPIVAESDSDRFVTASLLVVTPGEEIYSVFGHTALRMECPSKGLDYCFTFETESSVLAFLSGQSKANFIAVPTVDFLEPYRRDGRGVKQYRLNLLPHEKQELWRKLDTDMMEGANRKFNLLENNCTSMSMLMVESVMENERFVFGKMPPQMDFTNGKGIRFLARKSPWGEFLFMSLIGSEADADWDIEHKLSPELIVPVLQHAVIENVNTQRLRAVLKGQGKTLVTQTATSQASWLSPSLLFGGLFLFTLLLTASEWLLGWRKLAVCWDTVLLAGQSLLGSLLVYFTLFAGLFGVHWNWFLIPFNPLPLLLWLIGRKHPRYHQLYLLYASVLLAFLIFTPFITSQADAPHAFIVALLCVRCISNYFQSKIKKITR